jgi:hypothetical protein
MKSLLCLTASLLLAGCVAIPVPVERAVVEGKQFTESDLDFVQPGATTRSEVVGNLGKPTIWLSTLRILVYGLRRVETGVLWFVGAGLSGAGGLVEGESKEAIYLIFDDKDVVTHWGRAPVEHCGTWLGAATQWAGSENLAIPQARETFVEETPTAGQGLIYFYRPRDYQYFLPLAQPARRLPPGVADFADISEAGQLVGQIRWQSYVAVSVPPGPHSFTVNPDTDCVVNPELYRSASIRLDVAPESVTYVDVGIQAGLGTIDPILVERPRSASLAVIAELRESW